MEVGRRDRSVAPRGSPMRPEGHDAVRIAVGERPQKHGIDHAEDGRIRADAKAHYYYGQDREPRVLPEGPKGISEIHARTGAVYEPTVFPVNSIICRCGP